MSVSHSAHVGLMRPVMQRALTNLDGINFTDYSAVALLEGLGINLQREKPVATDQASVHRCAWIDQQLIGFFNQHPSASGIELAGGLSTRFHRLAGQMDWPRFTWCSIDNPHTTSVLAQVFPDMDNYQRVACEHPLDTWWRFIHWHCASPKIIVAAEQQPLNDHNALMALCQTMTTHLRARYAELIVSLQLDDNSLQTLCFDANIQLLQRMPTAGARDKAKPKHAVLPFLKHFFSKRDVAAPVSVLHLRIYPHPKELD